MTLEERMAIVETLMNEIKLQFGNHLKHHWAVEIMLATAVLALIVRVLVH